METLAILIHIFVVSLAARTYSSPQDANRQPFWNQGVLPAQEMRNPRGL